jgi:hypothetical protein
MGRRLRGRPSRSSNGPGVRQLHMMASQPVFSLAEAPPPQQSAWRASRRVRARLTHSHEREHARRNLV